MKKCPRPEPREVEPAPPPSTTPIPPSTVGLRCTAIYPMEALQCERLMDHGHQKHKVSGRAAGNGMWRLIVWDSVIPVETRETAIFARIRQELLAEEATKTEPCEAMMYGMACGCRNCEPDVLGGGV